MKFICRCRIEDPGCPALWHGFGGARSRANRRSPTGGLLGLPVAGTGEGNLSAPEPRLLLPFLGAHQNMGEETRSLLSGPIWVSV